MEKEFIFKSSTGIDVPAKEWKNENISEYKGIIQLVHGMQEHIGRYNDFANYLVDAGYIVVGHSHLGHGDTVKDEKDYGHFADEEGWSRLVDDIHNLQNYVQRLYPELPYTIMGHSMGSLLTRTYITKYKDNISKVIICGTSGQKYGLVSGKILIKLIMAVKGKRYRSELVKKLILGSFNKKFKPNRTEADWINRDNNEVDKYLADEKCGKNFTLQAYWDLLSGSQYLSEQKNIKNTPNIPILIISGDKDPVGANGKGVKRVYSMLSKAGKDKITLKLFKDARHEILNEINKDEVYKYILNWIDKN